MVFIISDHNPGEKADSHMEGIQGIILDWLSNSVSSDEVQDKK